MAVSGSGGGVERVASFRIRVGNEGLLPRWLAEDDREEPELVDEPLQLSFIERGER